MNEKLEQKYKEWFLKTYEKTSIYGDGSIIVGYSEEPSTLKGRGFSAGASP